MSQVSVHAVPDGMSATHVCGEWEKSIIKTQGHTGKAAGPGLWSHHDVFTVDKLRGGGRDEQLGTGDLAWKTQNGLETFYPDRSRHLALQTRKLQGGGGGGGSSGYTTSRQTTARLGTGASRQKTSRTPLLYN